MPVISLSCRSCGAPLQIRDGVEALACGHCGAAMKVEREGGAISLELERALGAISTGAAKTAAELALARLAREFYQCNERRQELTSRIASVEYGDGGTPRSAHLLEDPLLAAAEARGAWLASELQRKTSKKEAGCGVHLTAGLLGGGVTLLASRLLAAGWCLTAGLTCGAAVASMTAAGLAWEFYWSVEKLQSELRQVEDNLARHRRAVTSNAELAELRQRLADEDENWRRIDTEIARNRAIVSAR